MATVIVEVCQLSKRCTRDHDNDDDDDDDDDDGLYNFFTKLIGISFSIPVVNLQIVI